MLYRISKPVIGVFGTSSVQGKFTLQLKLREMLLSYGYKVGQIGTEPSAPLFGFDYVFPMGYNSSVYLTPFESIRYLNYIANDLSLKGNDVIIAGSQSGSVIYDFGNMEQFNLYQYYFLCGVQPDAIVLCVNAFDEIEYVQRTINFLESSVDSYVIALVVYPMQYSNNWRRNIGLSQRITTEEFEKIKTDFSTTLHKKTFLLGDEKQMKMLVDCIIEYFAE